MIESFAFYANQPATLLIHARKMTPTLYFLLSQRKQTWGRNLSHFPIHFRTSRKHIRTYSQQRIRETPVLSQTCLMIHGPLPRTQHLSIYHQRSPPHPHKAVMVAYPFLSLRHHLIHPNTWKTLLNISSPISLPPTTLKLPLPIPQANTRDLPQQNKNQSKDTFQTPRLSKQTTSL